MTSCGLVPSQDEDRSEESAERTEVVAVTTETSASGADVTEPAATQETSSVVTESAETSETEETSETSETDMPADEEGIPLTDAEALAFFASYADTYLMSSGVGGWGAYMIVNSDGSFDYNYHDSDFDMYYICHAQGRLGNVVMIDELTYKVEILEMTYEYTAGSEWSVTEPDGTVINYTGSDSYGLHAGDILTYYVRGNDVSALPEGYLWWYCAPRALQAENVQDPFPLSGYYNAVDECAYIEDDYE